jgi:hypothetical protein
MRLRASWKVRHLGLRFCHHSKPITEHRSEHLLEVYDACDRLKFSEVYTNVVTMHQEIRDLVKQWEIEANE